MDSELINKIYKITLSPIKEEFTDQPQITCGNTNNIEGFENEPQITCGNTEGFENEDFPQVKNSPIRVIGELKPVTPIKRSPDSPIKIIQELKPDSKYYFHTDDNQKLYLHQYRPKKEDSVSDNMFILILLGVIIYLVYETTKSL